MSKLHVHQAYWQGIAWNGMVILVWNVEDTRMEWKFQEWNQCCCQSNQNEVALAESEGALK